MEPYLKQSLNVPKLIILLAAVSPVMVGISQTNPTNVGWAVRTNVTSQGVALSGNYMYVADWGSGLSIWDIASKTNPILTGYTTTNYGGYAARVAIKDHYAIVANDTDGLRFYDVSTPSNAINVAHINDLYNSDGSPAYNGAEAYDLVLVGNCAFVANGFDGLRIYGISNPAAPTHVGHAVFNNAGEYAMGIAVQGHYAYLADYVGLSTYDISNLSSPTFLGTTNCNFNGGVANKVTVNGNYAYVANMMDGLRIFDLSNPANPISAGYVYTGSTSNNGVCAACVAIAGNYAYLGNYTDGMRIYNISNPTNPIYITTATNVWNAYASHVVISNNYAFIANAFDGVRIDFLGLPSSPQLKARPQGGSLELSWPAPSAGFTVLQSSGLNPPKWVALTNSSSVTNSRNQVLISSPTNTSFFRLKSW